MRNKKVLFIGKNHRTIRLDTINNPPNGVEFIKQETEEIPDHLANKRSVERSIIKKALDFTRYNNYIPQKDLKEIDLIYSPGKIIMNNFPWVVEIDNVACLSYYNLKILNKFKSFIADKLKSVWCKRIICISEAAKKSVVNYFKDKQISAKCEVVYPYVRLHNKTKRSDDKVRFLYISREFYLKGGRQIVNAFKKLKKQHDNVELTIISNWYNEKRIKGIKVVNPTKSKKELFKKYYSKHDVFLQLSFQDSFGSVVQEAISTGLPVICTDMFAFHEMVKDGINGFVLKSPIKYFKNFLPNERYWGRDLNKESELLSAKSLENELFKKMEVLAQDKSLREQMGLRSKELAKTLFFEQGRKKTLKGCLMGKVKYHLRTRRCKRCGKLYHGSKRSKFCEACYKPKGTGVKKWAYGLKIEVEE